MALLLIEPAGSCRDDLPRRRAERGFTDTLECELGRIVKIAALALLLVSTVPHETVAEPLIGQASVIDGDTLELHGERIRLMGIDAPESGQLCQLHGEPWRCGQTSALALADHIEGKTITCVGDDLDRYGRTLAVCRLGPEDVNRWMVEQGWALAYRKYSTAYIVDEDTARAGRRGIWASVFTPPWDWRKNH